MFQGPSYILEAVVCCLCLKAAAYLLQPSLPMYIIFLTSLQKYECTVFYIAFFRGLVILLYVAMLVFFFFFFFF